MNFLEKPQNKDVDFHKGFCFKLKL